MTAAIKIVREKMELKAHEPGLVESMSVRSGTVEGADDRMLSSCNRSQDKGPLARKFRVFQPSRGQPR